jgi:hypothetical protein
MQVAAVVVELVIKVAVIVVITRDDSAKAGEQRHEANLKVPGP